MTIRILISLVLLAAAPLPAQEKSIEQTLEALASSQVVTRRLALRAEADWKAPRLRTRLVELVRQDPDPNVREWSIDRLAIAPGGLAELFRERAEKDENPGPRAAAVLALGLCRREIDFDFFVATLSSGDRVAASAAYALAESGRPEAFAPLAGLLPTCGRDGWLGPAIPKAMMRLDAERALPLLLDGLVEPRSPRHWIAHELKEAGSRKALPRALELLVHEDDGTRRLAAAIVAVIGDEESIDPILAAMSAHPSEKASYLAALGKIGSSRALPVLMQSVGSDEKDVEARRAAAGALVRIRPEGRAKELEPRLAREADALVLVLLCEVLAELGEKESITALVPLLDDERRSDQPRRISSVWSYPWNVHLNEAAGHAIITLRDGRNPMPRSDLSIFPMDSSDLPQSMRARMWWSELENKAPYRRSD